MKLRTRALGGIVLGVLLWAPSADAQNAATRRHELFIESLKRTASEIESGALADVDSLEDWKAVRPRVRQRFLYMLGLDPLPPRTPLKTRVTGVQKRKEYRIEKIVFQSMPGLYVTGNLYLPKEVAGEATEPRATILYVCGHSPHPLGAKWSYQDRAVWFAEHGYVCFVLDTLEFGEVAGIHHGLHDLNMWDWLSRGYAPAGVEVWNAMRAIDYLQTRAEVDKARIGITGISGGGAVSWFAAAADERIAVAVPVCATYTFASQAKHWRASGQCDCIYFNNTFMTSFSTVGALIAPRPLMMCSGRKDPDFPPDGYHAAFRQAKRIYDLYSDAKTPSDRIEEVDEAVGHTDSPLFRREARQWMNRWLKGDDTPLEIVPNPSDKPSRPEELACLTSLPRDATNYRIHKSFVPSAPLRVPDTLDRWNDRRGELLRELKDKTFRWFPASEVPFAAKVGRFRGAYAARYADYEDVEIESEPGVPIRVQLLRARDRSKPRPLLLYVKRRGDSIYFLDLDELLPLLGRCDVAIVNPRLTEHPISGAEFADIERTAAWVGRTVAAMQVWDVLRTRRWLTEEKQLKPSSIAIYTKGDMGVVALYAALFEESITQVILSDPPVSHRRGPALLNVLRITDLPEVAAALAPRKLVFLDEVPSAYEFARAVYRLEKHPDRITTAKSLPEALEVWKY